MLRVARAHQSSHPSSPSRTVPGHQQPRADQQWQDEQDDSATAQEGSVEMAKIRCRLVRMCHVDDASWVPVGEWPRSLGRGRYAEGVQPAQDHSFAQRPGTDL